MIDRWCHGTKPYRTDLYDRDPVNPKPSVLNASITEASVKINDLPVSSFSASAIRQDVILTISYSHLNPVGPQATYHSISSYSTQTGIRTSWREWASPVLPVKVSQPLSRQ